MRNHLYALLAPILAALVSAGAAQFASGPNFDQISELGAEAAIPGGGKTPAAAAASAQSPRAVTPAVKSGDFVVMGYVQSSTPADSYPWHALTHVACPFVDFDASGIITNSSTWTGRASVFQPGGDADAHGVKVLMCVRNGGFSASTLDTVMQSAPLRAALVTSITNLIAAGGTNCAGVNLDFEPHPYASATRDGITLFLAALKAAISPKELSMYVGPTYSASSDAPGDWAANLDFMNFSCYPWSGSWSSTATAIAPDSSYDGQVDNFLANGCPPEKMVLTLPTYGHAMQTATYGYGATRTGAIGSFGFTEGRFDTTLGSPLRSRQYDAGSNSTWYSYSNGVDYDTYNYDDEFSLAVKMRPIRSWNGAQYTGRKLRGVAFWSLMWMCDGYFDGFQAYDMEAAAAVSRHRTYPQIYQAVQEIFAPPGTRTYEIEKFEVLEPRWRDPDEGTDDVGNNGSAVVIAATPAGAGKPANSDNCANLNFNFTSTAGSRIFFRHEILGDYNLTSVADRLAAKALFDVNSKVSVDVYTASAYAGRTLRFMIMDANGQVEMGPQNSLNASGWRTLELDLTSVAFAGYNTNFNEFTDGDGVLNTAGGGARDIACVGFLIEGGGTAGSGSIYLDELRFTRVNPQAKNYVINELRHATGATQFVEIYGPAGAFPSGMQLRLVAGTDGAAYSTINLNGQSIPNDAGGFGHFVVGVSGVPNVDVAIPTGTIQTGNPDAVQLYDSSTDNIYDAVVYKAFGGPGLLDGNDDPLVTQNGYPWLGEVADGTDSGGNGYSMGRYPDGANTWVNFDDFSAQVASPGTANAGALSLPLTWDFSSAPSDAVQTYQTMSVTASGVGASPSGGNVYRCVDTSGGGVQAFFGGPALGSAGNGYDVTGEIFATSSVHPLQAIGVGICGNQGSTFFSNSPAGSGYESGYWLILENAAGVGLNDGRPDHPGVFEFVQATNDNMDATPVTLLGSKTLAEVGVANGTWATFRLSINPGAAGDRLRAEINGIAVYSGPIPAGGPTSGSFQVGFRENHAGAPAANEGTWIDNVTLSMDTVPLSLSQFELY